MTPSEEKFVALVQAKAKALLAPGQMTSIDRDTTLKLLSHINSMSEAIDVLQAEVSKRKSFVFPTPQPSKEADERTKRWAEHGFASGFDSPG